MPDKVNLNAEKRIIEVYSFGELSFEEMAASIKKIKQIGEETDINLVLIDTSRVTSIPPAGDIFNIADIFPRNLKIAIFAPKDAAIREDLNFGVTVALNRGILINSFASKEEAEKWLLK
jgi:hypothetical protein